jgi:hypothetical protein
MNKVVEVVEEAMNNTYQEIDIKISPLADEEEELL